MSDIALRSDCGACRALCCVVPSFQRSADFAVSKPAGEPCRWLADHRCTIHGSLGAKGYAGCVVFECFGAGQRLSAEAGSGTLYGF